MKTITNIFLALFLTTLFACNSATEKDRESLLNEINSNQRAFSQYQGHFTINNNHIIEYVDDDNFYFRSYDLNDIKEVTLYTEPNFKIFSGLREFNLRFKCKKDDCIHLINGFNKTDGTRWDRMGSSFSIGFQNKEKAEYMKSLFEELIKN